MPLFPLEAALLRDIRRELARSQAIFDLARFRLDRNWPERRAVMDSHDGVLRVDFGT